MLQARPLQRAASAQPVKAGLPVLRRGSLVIRANWNPFNKGSGGGSEDAARKALENLGKGPGKGGKAGGDAKKGPEPSKPATPPADNAAPKNPLANLFGGGGGGSPPSGGGGGGGGGDGGGFGQSQPGPDGPTPSLLQEFLALMRGTWVLITNLALFLALASFLHRSLYWFVQNELLVAVGAPQQAFERFIGKFFEGIEWLEVYLLGWKVPGTDDDKNLMRTYEVLRHYTPEEAAYSFASLKYPNLSEADKRKLHRAYALRAWERPEGHAAVDPTEVRAIMDKLEPNEAERRAYKRARASGTLDAFWAARGGVPDWASAQAGAAK